MIIHDVQAVSVTKNSDGTTTLSYAPSEESVANVSENSGGTPAPNAFDAASIQWRHLPKIPTTYYEYARNVQFKEDCENWKRFLGGLPKGQKYIGVAALYDATDKRWQRSEMAFLMDVDPARITEWWPQCEKGGLIRK